MSTRSPVAPPRLPAQNGLGRTGFTILEMLVSCAVFLLILTLVAGMMSGASSLWLRHRNQSASFEAANAAFDSLTRTLAQAVLNTYWEVQTNQPGRTYGRSSELHFAMGPTSDLLGVSPSEYPGEAVFFQAALGRSAGTSLKRLPLLLNSMGYFVRFDKGPGLPAFLDNLANVRSRYRLYQWLQPSENFGVYQPNAGEQDWFRGDLANNMNNTAVLAENVIGLIFTAEYSDANGALVSAYSYDSRDPAGAATLHQLPPRIRVLMVVIDEASAARLANGTVEPAGLAPKAEWFKTPGQFDSDLTAWEDQLKSISPRVDYRIFTATVIIQNAKWSL